MTTGKTSAMTLRLERAFKEALHIAGKREHRRVAKLVGVMIGNGVPIPEQRESAASYIKRASAEALRIGDGAH